MFVKNKAIIVLSNLMDKYGNLNYESMQRAELANKIFRKNKARILITSGWNYRPDSSIFIADAFRKFFIEKKKMKKESIFCERNSRDTVGDAVFSRVFAYEKFKFQELIVVTSDYHLSRTKEIFEFIYNSSIKLEFYGAKVEKNSLNYDREKRSLDSFRNTFKNVERGNISSILRNLFLNHPFYNGDKFENNISVINKLD